jgi:tetratricopeptide (TPR) repeat protein
VRSNLRVMTGGREEERRVNELRQFELAEKFFNATRADEDWLFRLNPKERKLLFLELQSHQALHVAQGNEPEAALLLDGLEMVALPDEELSYKFKRLAITENERRGLGGRALAGMAELYEEYRRSRTHRARSAEVVMEYGILQDRHGDKEEAHKLFKHSIGRYERSGHQYNLAAAWFNSASVLYDLGRVRASINACEKGLELGGSSHLDLKTHLLLQRANCREKTREIDLAAQDYLDAADGYSKMGRRRQQCNILFRVGWLFGRQERLLDARNLLHAALKISKELDYSAGLSRFHLKRAQYLAGHDLDKKVQQHLQHAIMYSKLARLEKVEKVARGALFRNQLSRKRPLSFYMKARAPEADAKALAKASQGAYSHRVGDGAATRVWRDSPRSAGKDVTFLARLLAELGRRAHRPELLRQSNAVTAWQRSVRQGRRIL